MTAATTTARLGNCSALARLRRSEASACKGWWSPAARSDKGRQGPGSHPRVGCSRLLGILQRPAASVGEGQRAARSRARQSLRSCRKNLTSTRKRLLTCTVRL
uniref:Uncharacterized protein n=1 Tax=Arundo donax TaxID=35708 RepID=A0A0A9G4J7_ARUDO